MQNGIKIIKLLLTNLTIMLADIATIQILSKYFAQGSLFMMKAMLVIGIHKNSKNPDSALYLLSKSTR